MSGVSLACHAAGGCPRLARLTLDLHDGPDLHGPEPRRRDARRDADRLVEVLRLDQVVAADALRRLGERSVGHHPLPLPQAHRGRGRDRLERVAGPVVPALRDRVGELPVLRVDPLPLAIGEAGELRGVRVDQQHVLHEQPPSSMCRSGRPQFDIPTQGGAIMIRLHVFPPSPNAIKVIAAAHHLGIEFEPRIVDLTKGEQQKPEFVALNPNRKMPVLEEDGFVLWESNAILQYLASKKPEVGLVHTDPRRCADVARWQFWENAHWDPACSSLIFERLLKKLFGQGDPIPAEVEKGEAAVRRFGAVLDRWLAGRRFLCGDELTLADFSVGAWLNYAERAAYPIDELGQVRRWYAGLVELPAWRESIVVPPPSLA